MSMHIAPTYGMYQVCANINDVNIVSVPMTPEFNLDIPSIRKAVNENPSIRIIFLCSPNNPTSNLLKESDVIDVLQIDFKGTYPTDLIKHTKLCMYMLNIN